MTGRSWSRGPSTHLLACLARLATRRATAVALVVAITAGAVALLPRFRIEPDLSAMFPQDHPALALLTDPEVGGKASRTLFVLVEGPQLAERLPGWVERLRASPLLEEVTATREELAAEQLATAPGSALFAASEAALAEIERGLTPPGRRAAIAEAVELARADPVAGRRILTEDPLGIRWVLELAMRESRLAELDPGSPYLLHRSGAAALIRVVGKTDPFDLDASRAIMAFLETALADAQPRFLGGYAVAREDSVRIRGDMENSLIWSIPCLFLYLLWATRSWLLPHLIFLPVLLSLLWTMGFGGALLGPLTPLAVSGAAILMGLCLDYPIHYVPAHRSGRGTLRTNLTTGRVILFSMLTSVAAFLSLGWGSFTGLRSFGLLLALGLALGALATFLVLPPLLRGLRVAKFDPRVGGSFLLRSAGTRGGRIVALFVVATALLGWAGLAAGRVDFSADPAAMRPADSATTAAAEAVERTFGFSPFGVQALVPATVTLPELRAAADALCADGRVILAAGPQQGVASPERSQRLRELDARITGWREGTIADLRAEGVKPAALEPALAGLESALRREDAHVPPPWEWQGRQYWPVTFLIGARGASQSDRFALRDLMIARLPPGTLLMDPDGLADELEAHLETDLLRAMLLAGGAVLVMSLLALKSARAGLLALVPVAIGLGVVLAILAWTGLRLGPASFIALPLILGLGVDDGLHVASLARARRRPSSARADAVPESLARTGAAIRDTTFSTMIGFGSLASAASPGIAALGVLVAAGVLFCYLASIMILPRLLFGNDAAAARADAGRRPGSAA